MREGSSKSVAKNQRFCFLNYKYTYLWTNWLGRGSFLDFYSDFHKTVVIRSSVFRTILIRRALASPDPGASNGGSNFIFRHFGTDMAAFEVARK